MRNTMSNTMSNILFALLGMLLPAGCATTTTTTTTTNMTTNTTSTTTTTNTACTCPVAKVNNGWCNDCELGYVAGVMINSQMLFEALDAHGHEIGPGGVQCDSCQKAIQIDGYCERDRIGWVNQQAYFSTLTYRLAKGQATDISTISCPICRANAQTQGWCDSCRVGMVGNVAFDNKEDFQEASQPYGVLLGAAEMAETCEMCASAMLFDSTCPVCRITYKNGKEILVPKP